MSARRKLWVAGAAVACTAGGALLAVPTWADQGAGVQYSGPVTITKGGTYSGNWQSTDPGVPAVKVATTEPVTIENSSIRSAGDAIWALADRRAGGVTLTVRGVTAEGLNPNVAQKQKGCFVDVGNFVSATIENNSTESVGCGVRALDFGPDQYATGQHLSVRYNRMHDVDGRKSDGDGGYLNDLSGSFANAVGLNTLRGAHVQIAWNEIVDEPSKSRVEDTISTYESSGTAGDRIDISNNYIQGAYPPDPAAHVDYSGTGINVGDATNRDDVGYVHVHDNQVVSIDNGGIGLSAGHDDEVDHNRVLSARTAADGTVLGGNWRTTVALWDFYDGKANGFWHDNSIHDNAVNMVDRDGKAAGDMIRSADATDVAYGNTNTWGHLATPDDERAEFALWQRKVSDAGVTLGAGGGTSPAPAPAPSGAPADGVYTLIGTQSGKALDVRGCSTDTYAPIQIWPYWGGDCQKWRLTSIGDGYYTVVSVHSGLALDVSGVSTADRATVQQYPYVGGANQQWKVVRNADGTYSLLARHSGKALDVAGCATTDGTPLIQWPLWGGPCQTWALTPA